MGQLPLTKRQKETEEWITAYIAAHKGVAPSLLDMADGLGISSSSAAYLVRALIQRGRARRVPKLWRSLELIPEKRERQRA